LETAVEVAEFQRKMSYEMAPDTALKVYAGVTLMPFPEGLICVGAGNGPTVNPKDGLHGPIPYPLSDLTYQA
jgi:hypothetical protein